MRAERLDRLGLGDDVEIAPTLVELEVHVAGGLEPRAEPRLRLAHALGDGPHLAAATGHQHDDAVGLAELVGAEHHAGVAVERHQAGPSVSGTVAGGVGCEATEAAVAPLELVDAGVEVGAAEVGPERRR